MLLTSAEELPVFECCASVHSSLCGVGSGVVVVEGAERVEGEGSRKTRATLRFISLGFYESFKERE